MWHEHNASDMVSALKEYHDFGITLAGFVGFVLTPRKGTMHAEQSNLNKHIVEQNEQVWRPMGNSTTNYAKHEM